ncbi:MAG: hypothetical protein KDD38_00985 [Bdellovibrionales bacterium]|nr:hypothetical protein [Bdellovibrionales bacterium]
MQKKKIDSHKIMKRLESKKSDRQKITLYLSRQLYEDLKKKCRDVAPSQIIEELVREFIAGLD